MKYPFNVVCVREDSEIYWVAKSVCLNGCIGQGDSADEAIRELEGNESMWLETAAEVGIDIPEIPVEEDTKYSGKLSLRMSPAVHKKAVENAKREGVSLNQYVNDAIVNYNAELNTAGFIAREVVSAAQNIGRGMTKNAVVYPCGNED